MFKPILVYHFEKDSIARYYDTSEILHDSISNILYRVIRSSHRSMQIISQRWWPDLFLN